MARRLKEKIGKACYRMLQITFFTGMFKSQYCHLMLLPDICSSSVSESLGE